MRTCAFACVRRHGTLRFAIDDSGVPVASEVDCIQKQDCQQHGSWVQSGQENRTKPIVVRLSGREAEANRKAVGVYNGVNFAGKSPPRATNILRSIAATQAPCWCTRTTDVSIICAAAS